LYYCQRHKDIAIVESKLGKVKLPINDFINLVD
jgi:hypothetical protein